jgi:hypothetical protein
MNEITDTDRLNYLIEHSDTWSPRQTVSGTKVWNPALGWVAEEKSYGGYWYDGDGYDGYATPITPEAEDGDPRTALDLAIMKERNTPR